MKFVEILPYLIRGDKISNQDWPNKSYVYWDNEHKTFMSVTNGDLPVGSHSCWFNDFTLPDLILSSNPDVHNDKWEVYEEPGEVLKNLVVGTKFRFVSNDEREWMVISVDGKMGVIETDGSSARGFCFLSLYKTWENERVEVIQ